MTKYERSLIEKDFSDKAHSADPIEASITRDRFLYFSVPGRPEGAKGYTLHIPKGKGIPDDILLKF